MVGKKTIFLVTKWKKKKNNYLIKKTWVTLIGWLPSRNITSCTLWANEHLVLTLNKKILTIQKVIRSCNMNIVIIQHYETHLSKNQEWYVKEIDYQNFNKESKNSSRIVSNNQQWNWILDSLHTFALHIHWALARIEI